MHELTGAYPRSGEFTHLTFDNRVPLVAHRLGDNPTPLRTVLQDQGLAQETIDQLVSPEGEWIYRVEERIDPYEMGPHDLLMTLTEHLGPVYEGANASLNSHIEGFNLHGINHARKVGEVGLSLLRAGRYDLDTQRRFVVAAAAHDIGNILSRQGQSEIAAKLLAEIFPNLNFTQKDFAIVESSIKMHDEDTATKILEDIMDTIEGSETENTESGKKKLEERTQTMKRLFGPEALALIIADKSDIGRSRLSPRPRSIEDPHREVNLLLQTTAIQKKGRGIYWDIDYTPWVTEEEAAVLAPDLYMRRSTAPGLKARVSDTTQSEWRQNEQQHFKTVTGKQFTKIYTGRVILAVEAAFAMFPDLDIFQINFTDREGERKVTISPQSTRRRRDKLLRELPQQLRDLEGLHHPTKPPKVSDNQAPDF